MATKVAAQATSKPATVGAAFKVRKEAVVAEPASPVDTIASIKADGAKLADRLRALCPVKELKAPIVATKGQARMMTRMVEIDSLLAEMVAPLSDERKKLKAELDAIVDTAQAAGIVAESVGLQYTAEPAQASVAVKVAYVSHHIRGITK